MQEQAVQHRFDTNSIRLPNLGLQTVYIKDTVFEPFLSPLSLSGGEQISLQIYFDIGNLKYDNNVNEVTLTVFIKTYLAEKPLYNMEIKQAGIFDLREYESEETHRLLGYCCPQILYQYARELANRLAQRGGFPPIFLPYIDFKILYEQTMADAKK